MLFLFYCEKNRESACGEIFFHFSPFLLTSLKHDKNRGRQSLDTVPSRRLKTEKSRVYVECFQRRKNRNKVKKRTKNNIENLKKYQYLLRFWKKK